MKKLFTLIASALFAVGASAEDSYSIVKSDPNVVAEGGTSITSVDGITLTFSNTITDWKVGGSANDAKDVDGVSLTGYYAQSNATNNAPVSFATTQPGTLTIFLGGALNGTSHTVYMTDEASNGLSGTVLEGDTFENGTKPVVAAWGAVVYTLEANKTYQFSVGGTKWRLAGFRYVISEDNGSDDPSVGGGDDNGDDNPGGDAGDKGDDNPGGDEGDDTPGEAIANWDFTKWSEATVAALKADAANWSDDEKDNGTTVEGKCYWNVANGAIIGEDGSLMANGAAIEEFKGLKFEGTPAKRALLAIGVDYGETSIGKYEGGAYLWMSAKGDITFTIPQVPGGSVIKIGVESHKNLEGNSEARGVKLTGAETTDALPTTYEVQTWKVPAGEAVDVKVQDTAGCHLYFIEIAEGTADDTPGEGEGGDGGEGTGIQQVAVKSGNSVIINLAGQKVDSNYKGIVIKDGKKYVQK